MLARAHLKVTLHAVNPVTVGHVTRVDYGGTFLVGERWHRTVIVRVRSFHTFRKHENMAPRSIF